MRCATCGADAAASAHFCSSCGAPLGLACPACGSTATRRAHASAPNAVHYLSAGIPRQGPPQRRFRPNAASCTVMFCDLAGSTELSARLDPEDFGAMIRVYHAHAGEVIGRFGGFIARYVGDGLLIYFGWPEARELAAERAVRAALAVKAAVSEVPIRGEQLRVRIGIAAGLVVVGEPIGSGESRQMTAIGETPNRAARLQGIAEPDGVAIDAATRQQIGGFFNCSDMGEIELKGLPRPVRVWTVLGESGVQSRFEALHGSAITPLVGREEELALLARRWRQAATGTGRLALLGAEPGIGKSRVIHEFRGRLADEPHTPITCFCAPHQQDNAYHPIIAHLERAACFGPGDPAATRLNKLEAFARSGRRRCRGDHADRRTPVRADRRALSAVGVEPPPTADPHDRCADRAACRHRASRPGVAGVRGCALDRSDLARGA